VRPGPYDPATGRIHVLAAMCSTCIFRPGNLMALAPGRIAGMVREAERNQSAIPCHDTLYRDDVAPAVCRGFLDRKGAVWTQPLQVAERLGRITEDPPPPPRA
jgi:hypothetical protein